MTYANPYRLEEGEICPRCRGSGVVTKQYYGGDADDEPCPICREELSTSEYVMFDRWLDRVTGVPKQHWVDRDETGYSDDD